LRDSGSGKDRKVQLTDEARRLILDTRAESPEREAAIKQAALNPKIHAKLWKKWGAEIPPDDSFRHTLIFDMEFNENTASDFIREYKDTIRFAKLNESDTVSVGNGDIQEDEMPAEEPENSFQGAPPKAQQRQPAQPGSKEISMPVGVSEEGQVISAHVRFDAPLKKDFLASLRGLLEALEKGLA
jgi:hypothetical protein